VQQKYGSDRLVVVLLNVDPDPAYGTGDRYIGRSKSILEKLKIDWLNVFLPGGWNDVMHVFNVGGYSTIAVDARGIVRGTNLHAQEVERVVGKLMEETKTEKPLR
jgi:hypothetical protein